MATVTHYIRSSYSPSQRDRYLRETNQEVLAPIDSTSKFPIYQNKPYNENGEDPWTTESTFSAFRRVQRAPRFVSAQIKYDEWGNVLENDTDGAESSNAGMKKDGTEEGREGVAVWYREVTKSRRGDVHMEDGSNGSGTGSDSHQTQAREQPQRPSNTDADTTSIDPSPSKRKGKRKHKYSNWFTTRPFPTTSPISQSTLADMLSRSPPPSPAQERHKPPVFLHLGPDNRGWRMLVRSGWSEGEGLGVNAHAGRKKIKKVKADAEDLVKKEETAKKEQEVVDVDALEEEIMDVDAFVEMQDAKAKAAQVIDLTLLDSEPESELEDGMEEGEWFEDLQPKPVESDSDATLDDDEGFQHDPTRTTLLTPLPTILKSDRLGIGMHHRRVRKLRGKKVTHTSQALKEHVKRGEEMKKRKKEVGKGRRAFEKMKKREEEERRRLLGYLNQ